jgi:hypothetical protein
MKNLEYLPKGSVKKEKVKEIEEKKGDLKEEDRIEIRDRVSKVMVAWATGPKGEPIKLFDKANIVNSNFKLKSLIHFAVEDMKKEKNDKYIWTFLEEMEKYMETEKYDEAFTELARKYIEEKKPNYSRGIEEELEKVG